VDQSNGLADAIVASARTLKGNLYHSCPWVIISFGVKVLQDRFPSAKVLATPAVVARMKLQITPEK